MVQSRLKLFTSLPTKTQLGSRKSSTLVAQVTSTLELLLSDMLKLVVTAKLLWNLQTLQLSVESQSLAAEPNALLNVMTSTTSYMSQLKVKAKSKKK